MMPTPRLTVLATPSAVASALGAVRRALLVRGNRMNIVTAIAVVVIVTGLAACSVTPTTIVQGPLTARSRPPASSEGTPGAIFQNAAYRPLFEDRRARLVGDIITISIAEKTSAGKQSNNSASKTGSVEASVPKLFGVAANALSGLGASAKAATSYDDKGLVSATNNFTGTISVTVVEVFSNGNLLVSGEKQVAFDKGGEFVRFSGVVTPDAIAPGNIVSSTQVADARVEYRTNSHIDRAEVSNWLTRFFLSFVPL